MNIKKAIQLSQENDLKVTKRRKNMLEFLEGVDGYRSAKEVMEHMELIHPSMSFDTVYRNLHLFDELEVLESTTLQGEKHFRMNCSTEHHHHFICNDCGKTKKIRVCPMDEIEKMLTNYFVEDHKFEIYGLCPKCLPA